MAGLANFLPELLGDGDLEGRWYGNDTVWRMVLDLNRLVIYGLRDGTICDSPQRSIYTLTDGILAGEHNGPLAPEPLPLGVVTFGRNSCAMDLVHAGLLHFDWMKIPLVRESFRQDIRFPLSGFSSVKVRVRTADGILDPSGASETFGVACRPPGGWLNHIEL
jgi:hypothetical protein